MRNRRKRNNQMRGKIMEMAQRSFPQNWEKLKNQKKMKPIQNFPNLLVLEKRLIEWVQRFSTPTMRN